MLPILTESITVAFVCFNLGCCAKVLANTPYKRHRSKATNSIKYSVFIYFSIL